jgi:MFS family permease
VKNPAGFYGAAIILGFGNGVVFPTFQAMTNNMVSQNRRGAANSTLFTSVDLGMGIGMIIVGAISQRYSISAAFLVCSFISASALAFFLIYSAAHYRKYMVKTEAI